MIGTLLFYGILLGILYVLGIAFRDFLIVSYAPSNIDAKGKPFLVTGAASGIGNGIVRELLAKGAFIFATDVNENALKDLYGNEANVRYYKMDVTSQDDVNKVVKLVQDEGKGLYGVVNSAGIGAPIGRDPLKFKLVSEIDVEKEARAVLEINLIGTIRVNCAFVDMIVASKGVIVNIASVAGKLPLAGYGAIYTASKFGVNGYSSSLALELKPLGVRVVCIEPGWVLTPLTEFFKRGTAFDTSTSRFKSAADVLVKRKVFNSVTRATFMTAEFCAKFIVRVVLTDPVPSHVLVDKLSNRIIYTILCTIPQKWLFNLLEK